MEGESGGQAIPGKVGTCGVYSEGASQNEQPFQGTAPSPGRPHRHSGRKKVVQGGPWQRVVTATRRCTGEGAREGEMVRAGGSATVLVTEDTKRRATRDGGQPFMAIPPLWGAKNGCSVALWSCSQGAWTDHAMDGKVPQAEPQKIDFVMLLAHLNVKCRNKKGREARACARQPGSSLVARERGLQRTFVPQCFLASQPHRHTHPPCLPSRQRGSATKPPVCNHSTPFNSHG